ncbi:MAG: PIN domain-containing protein [Promethearchaeota archaeon]
MRSKHNLIILDSNFILLPFQFKVDYLNEVKLNLEGGVEFIIFKQILDELGAKQVREPNATKFQRDFKSGISYLEKNRNKYEITFLDEIKKDNETTDNFLLRRGIELKNEGYVIFLATNDSILRKKAKEFGLNTIFLRQKKYLSFERT